MRIALPSHAAGRWRLWVALCAGWILFVAGSYATMIGRLSANRLRNFFADADDFFLWQSAGFVLLAASLSALRPALVGRGAAVYWGSSTVALLLFSSELRLPLEFTAFALWCILAVSACRRLIERFVGPDHATSGMALSVLYAAMIPLAFFLGLLQLMSFWPLALLALGIALPGAAGPATWRRTGKSFLGRLDRLNPVGAAALQAVWVSLALSFVWSSGPEALSDSIRSYLPEVQAIARQQGFEPQYVDSGRFLPRALQAVGAAGYVLGSYHVAKWLSWLATVALLILVMEEIARRSGRMNLAVLGGAATLACPLLLTLSTSLMFDHVMTLFCVAIFVSLSRALDAGSRRAVLLSAFVVGCAMQIKYNFLIFAFIWLLWLIFHAFRTYGVRAGMQWSLLPILLSGVVGCPWFLYTWATVGNPFYPFFNELFESHYWPEGMSPSLGVGRKFNLGESFFDRLFFPWTVTFHTSRINQGPDGGMGFQLLALLPFALVIRGRRQSGLDLGAAGAAAVAGVCLSTTVARYWMPGYPLLLIPLFLAAGESVGATRWPLPRWLAPLAVLMVLAGLLVQVPFWTASHHIFPWPMYTKAVSESAWLTERFPGFPAIERLSEILEPDDRVLVTDYEAVHTIDAAAFEFPFWHCLTLDEDNFSINGVRNAELLDRYLERHSIKYWAVNFSRGHFSLFDYHFGTGARYWTASRLVSGSAGLAVFEIAKRKETQGFRSAQIRVVPPVLLPKERPRKLLADRAGWQDQYAHKPEKAARAVSESIQMPQRGTVSHLFSVPPGVALIKARVYLQSRGPLAATHLTIEWLDDKGEEISRITNRFRYPWGKDWAHIFGTIPDAAQYGRLRVVRWAQKPLNVGDAELEFLARPSSS